MFIVLKQMQGTTHTCGVDADGTIHEDIARAELFESNAQAQAVARKHGGQVGALMLRRANGEWQGRFACRLCRDSADGVHPSHNGRCRLWQPLAAFRRSECDVVAIPLDILIAVNGTLPAATFDAEGGFRVENN